MKKITSLLTIAAVSTIIAATATTTNAASDDDLFADLMNEVSATEEVTEDVSVKTGDASVDEDPIAEDTKEVESVTSQDGVFSLILDDSSQYITGSVNEEGGVLKSFKVSFKNDFGDTEELKEADLLDQFDITVISVDGAEEKVSGEKNVTPSDIVNVTLSSDSILTGVKVTYTTFSYVPESVNEVDLLTATEDLIKDINSTSSEAEEVEAKEVKVTTPADKETGAAENAMLLIGLLGAAYVGGRKFMKAE